MTLLSRKLLRVAVLFIVCLLGITSCSTSTSHYSKKEIINYVKNVFGKDYKLTEVDTGNYSYTFQNSEGFTFTITTYTYNVHFDASETTFYNKGLRTDYTERVLKYHADDILDLLEKFDLNIDTTYGYCKIYVDDADEFELLSDFISKLDHILAYSFNNDNIPSNMSEYKANTLLVCIYFKDTEMSNIKLSSNGDERIESDQVYAEIEEDYVNCVKTGELNVDIDKELWDNYPASIIDIMYINGESLNTDVYDLYTLYYQSDMGTYSILNLDPFEIFEDTPYSYKAGALAYLVNRLGGTYTSVDWNEARWTVDGVTWEATLHTYKNVDTTYLEVRRNGMELELTDSAIYGSNGNITNRNYTIEDLELMLDLEIKIDQTNIVAYITKKNKYGS